MTFSSGIQANIRRLTLYAALFLLAGSSIFGQNKFERKIVSETLIAHIPVTLSIPETLAVSPNGRRTAYIAKTSGHFRVVLDGVEQKTYETLGLGPGQFSPDSKSVAYVAGSSGKQFVVADGKELEPYDAILMGTP